MVNTTLTNGSNLILCLWYAQRTRHHVMFLPKTFNLIYSLRNQPQKSKLRDILQNYRPILLKETEQIWQLTSSYRSVHKWGKGKTALGHYWGHLGRQYCICYIMLNFLNMVSILWLHKEMFLFLGATPWSV